MNEKASRWTAEDEQFMQKALRLGRRGEGRVEPNPMVGCVIVRGGRIVGRGFHQKFGGPHAEVHALRAAGRRAAGATAYVTLEPCCHFGKTPPCVDALIEAGVGRVVVATRDPNTLVAGRGLRKLRAAGIRVELGLLRAEADELIAPFATFQRDGRPYVILKWAQSIDGKIATRSGDSKWITSVESRRAAHALRARVDAVVVGIDTVLTDDPDLTARLARPLRRATRVILDSQLRIPIKSRVVRTARRVPTLIVAVSPDRRGPRDAFPDIGAMIEFVGRISELEAAGCRVLCVKPSRRVDRNDPSSGGHVDLRAMLAELRGMNMTNVLVEGGGIVLGAFLDAGLADEARIFVAPKLIGGFDAPSPLRGLGPRDMKRLPRVRMIESRRCGPDTCYHLRFG